MKDLHAELEKRRAGHLYRRRRVSDSPQRPEMIIDGREVIGFCSNDYLGLADHPEVRAAFIDGVQRYGAGSGAAHLVNGHGRAHHELEEALAEFTGYPRALLFSTGYMANIGIAQALAGRDDIVYEDRLNHASLIDAGLACPARLVRYRHRDLAELNARLERQDRGEKLVMSDAVFSMDGDIADAAELAGSCRKQDALLVLDDAHGFGVLGDMGRGTLSHTGVRQESVPVYMATLGKAAGTAGAFVAGSEDIIETLIQSARTYVYTTAQPPAIACATLASLRLMREEPQRQQRLADNVAYFRQCAAQAGIEPVDSMTAIQPVITGDNETALELSASLLEKGILVTAIRPPTVPEGTARLRITLSASHTRQHIERLVDALQGAVG